MNAAEPSILNDSKPTEWGRSICRTTQPSDWSASSVSLIGVHWLFLPVSPSQESLAEDIDTSKNQTSAETQRTSHESRHLRLHLQEKGPKRYEQDWIEKYAHYFLGNTILPILKLAQVSKPRTLSFILFDLRTWRLTDLQKERFENLLKPCWVFLPLQLCHIGHPTAHRGGGKETCQEDYSHQIFPTKAKYIHIYQPLCAGRIWHKVNF